MKDDFILFWVERTKNKYDNRKQKNKKCGGTAEEEEQDHFNFNFFLLLLAAAASVGSAT